MFLQSGSHFYQTFESNAYLGSWNEGLLHLLKVLSELSKFTKAKKHSAMVGLETILKHSRVEKLTQKNS